LRLFAEWAIDERVDGRPLAGLDEMFRLDELPSVRGCQVSRSGAERPGKEYRTGERLVPVATVIGHSLPVELAGGANRRNRQQVRSSALTEREHQLHDAILDVPHFHTIVGHYALLTQRAILLRGLSRRGGTVSGPALPASARARHESASTGRAAARAPS